MGEVFSQAEGFTNVWTLLPAYLFHAVAMALGAFCIQKGKAPAREPAAELQRAV